MNSRDLRGEAEAARYLLAMVAERQGTPVDDDTADSIIESETMLAEAISGTLCDLDEAEMMVKGIDARMAELKARKERLAATAGRIRDEILTALSIAGRRYLRTPGATLSVGTAARGVVLTDEDEVPDIYRREVVTRPIDKAVVRERLMAGDTIRGAELTNERATLTIRKA